MNLVRFQSSLAKPIASEPVSSKVFASLDQISADEVVGSKSFGGVKSRTYFIKRSKFGHLPVYKTIKSKAIYTEVRKIQGNSIQLRSELLELIPELSPKNLKIVQQSNKLLMKGDYVDVVKDVLSLKF